MVLQHLLKRPLAVLPLALVGCHPVPPNTSIWQRTESPDHRIDAVVAWEEDNIGATGGTGFLKLFLVRHGGAVDVTGKAVAVFGPDGSDGPYQGVDVLWVGPKAVQVTTTHYNLSEGAEEYAIDGSLIGISYVRAAR